MKSLLDRTHVIDKLEASAVSLPLDRAIAD